MAVWDFFRVDGAYSTAGKKINGGASAGGSRCQEKLDRLSVMVTLLRNPNPAVFILLKVPQSISTPQSSEDQLCHL